MIRRLAGRLAIAIGVVAVNLGCATETSPSVSPPTPLLATDGCGVVDTRVALARTSPSEELVVVRLMPLTGCGGTGQWIVGKAVSERDQRMFFLGFSGTSARGCQMWQASPPRGAFGVVRANPTAALFRPADEACLAFDGGPIQSSLSTRGATIFATLADAESFAAWARDEDLSR